MLSREMVVGYLNLNAAYTQSLHHTSLVGTVSTKLVMRLVCPRSTLHTRLYFQELCRLASMRCTYGRDEVAAR